MNKSLALGVALAIVVAGCGRSEPILMAGESAPALAGQAPGAEEPLLPGAALLSMQVQAERPDRRAIAAMPDQGTLARYPDVRGEQQGPNTWYRTELSEMHAIRAVAGGTLDYTSPTGERMRFRYQRHEILSDGDWTWVGVLDGADPGRQAVLTFGEDAVFGNIPLPGGGELVVTTRAGQLWTMQTDPGLLARQPRPQGTDFLIPRAPANDADRGGVSLARAMTAQAGTTGTPLVDLVVGFTTGHKDMFGSASAARTRINHLAGLANQAYENSGLPGRVRVVHAMEVGYADTSTNETAIHELTGSDGSSDVPVPTSLQLLRNARETYGGDLVVLVRRFKDVQDSCGIAWLLGGGQQTLNVGWESFGYGVVSDSNGGSFPDGGHFCSNDTFAHEVGHNMGNAHDVETAKGEDGVLDGEDYGRYPYSFGYKTDAGNGNFYTVMAYGDDGQTSYRIFSTPDSTFCGGKACGTDDIDAARSMEQTMPIIAQFRAQVVPVAAGYAHNDVDGDGLSDILWRQDVTAKKNFRWWPMNGASRGPTGFETLSTPYVLRATGDFNGDGIADLVWRKDGDTRILIWLGTGTGFSRHSIHSYGAGWDVVGAADVDGDGKSDILWRQNVTAKNNFRWWPMDGLTRGPTGADTLSAKHTLEAVGDFNGDGRADLVWRNGQASKVYVWLSQGSSFTRNTMSSYGTGWDVAGAGDVNGDGRDDILWRQNVTAKNNFRWWPMNGASRGSTGADTLSAKHTLEATGDFDGDGLLDLVWRNGHESRVLIWMGTDSGFSRGTMNSYGAGWDVVDSGP